MTNGRTEAIAIYPQRFFLKKRGDNKQTNKTNFLLSLMGTLLNHKLTLCILMDCPLYTMHNKFSNCFVWVSPSTSDLEFHLLS